MWIAFSLPFGKTRPEVLSCAELCISLYLNLTSNYFRGLNKGLKNTHRTSSNFKCIFNYSVLFQSSFSVFSILSYNHFSRYQTQSAGRNNHPVAYRDVVPPFIGSFAAFSEFQLIPLFILSCVNYISEHEWYVVDLMFL